MTVLEEARAAAQLGRADAAAGILAEAAQNGDETAAFELAFWFLQGRGIPRSLKSAHAYFAKAAELGHAEAKSIHIALLANGADGARDWTEALKLLNEAAAKGDQQARLQLGLVEAMELTASGDPRELPPSEQISERPDVKRFRNFFSAAECAYLIEAAAPAFQPAVVGHVGGGFGQRVVAQIRTCAVAGFPWVAEDTAIHALNRRIAFASQTAAECGEPLQILHYLPGQEFKPHRDATEDTANQRILTMLVYLNEAYSGGETLFLKTGLKVRGKAGDAILFRNADDHGQADPDCLHAGLPVTSGEKYLASRWIRQKRFGPAVG
jgi:prolyl 4-hydroxylase